MGSFPSFGDQKLWIPHSTHRRDTILRPRCGYGRWTAHPSSWLKRPQFGRRRAGSPAAGGPGRGGGLLAQHLTPPDPVLLAIACARCSVVSTGRWARMIFHSRLKAPAEFRSSGQRKCQVEVMTHQLSAFMPAGACQAGPAPGEVLPPAATARQDCANLGAVRRLLVAISAPV